MADIRIPKALLPNDGRFGSGPSKVPHTAVAALSTISDTFLGTSHRQSTVKKQVARLREGIADFFNVPNGYEVILGNGGTTAFWEVAVFGLIEKTAQAASFGEFGSKFATAINDAPFLDDPRIVKAEPGTVARLRHDDRVDTYATPHNETSTGVCVPVERVPGGLMLHDATSAVAGLPVDMTQTDVYYFAPQKGLASDGGLWIAIMSPDAIHRAEQIAATDRYIPKFLDLSTAIDNSRKNQTYNTPALATIFLAAEQIDTMRANGGLDASVKRCADSASRLYDWADKSPHASPFVSDRNMRSNVVVTIDFPDEIDAAAISSVLRANGVVDTEPYRKLGRNQLRVATYPAVNPDDVTALTHCIDYVIGQQ